MGRVKNILAKTSAVVRKGPATLRNIVYSRMDYWPVGRIDGSDLQSVPTYCISLLRAQKKRWLIERQVEKLGLSNFEFIDAVDARAMSVDALIEAGTYDAKRSAEFHPGGLTLNEVACSLSHGLAYERVVREKHAVALIIEDDALFVHKRMRAFSLGNAPRDFDVILLNSFLLHEPPRGKIRPGIYDVTSYHGSAAAYLVSAKGASKLLKAYLPVVHAADGLIGRCMELAPEEASNFKQLGVATTICCYLSHPDCVLNGSTSHYHTSDVQQG